ncbi:MAG: Cof-type HAD-IIB family hydrolase [Oscillospiraceae bacterium]|nr:Cof-type HAD-IIB family hydrolase [Oscillospiraceae bacterium]
MQYKLIAADMDGTLLNPNRTISKKTLTAIRQVLDMGVIFTVSTGRPMAGMRQYQEILQLKTPIITYNGGAIVMPDSGEVLYQKNLEPQAAASVIYRGQVLDASMCIWSEDKLYILREDAYTTQYAERAGGAILVGETEIADIIRQGIGKILWYDAPENVAMYQDALDRTPIEHVTYFTSSPAFLEIVDHQVSKGHALQLLGAHHGISMAEMIAIGDGMNDLTMLEYAGLGVAMGNASDTVKAAADVVTASNADDGVAQAIERFVLS